MIMLYVMAIVEASYQYFTLENAVLLAIAGLILLVSLLTLTLLDVWNWIGHVLKRSSDHSKVHKRSRTRNRHSSGNRAVDSASERVGDLQQTRKHTSNRRRQPRPRVKTRQLQRPCKGCKGDEAKRDCEFGFCATCCRVSSSSCQAHGTGFMAVSAIVESAATHKYPQLDISYANLRTCPQSLTSVGHQLISLNLSNNRLTLLPDSIGALSGLKELFLQYNYLRRLPSNVCQLKKLIELDVKNNRLASLPECLGNLKCLNTLCLTNNLLTSLPSSIGKLSELQELSIHSNSLKQLPRTICRLKNLRFFFSGDNKLQHLPADFGNLVHLEELDLSGCELVSLPESIARCSSLTKLWVSSNKLTSLPSQIGSLHSLKEFHLRNNLISFFPVSLSHLNFYTFSAQGNPTITEEQARQATRSPTQSLPSLLELAARVIVSKRVQWSADNLPDHLEKLLSRPVYCSHCGGPVFTHFSSSITFHTVGTYYWLPLLQLNCSPHRQNQQCGGLAS